MTSNKFGQFLVKFIFLILKPDYWKFPWTDNPDLGNSHFSFFVKNTYLCNPKECEILCSIFCIFNVIINMEHTISNLKHRIQNWQFYRGVAQSGPAFSGILEKLRKSKIFYFSGFACPACGGKVESSNVDDLILKILNCKISRGVAYSGLIDPPSPF